MKTWILGFCLMMPYLSCEKKKWLPWAMIIMLCCTKQNQVSQQAWYLPWPLASEARSFRSAAPTLWNRLPDMLQQAKDRASFQQQLKSLLFLSPSPHPMPLPFPMSSSIIPPPPPSILPSTVNMCFFAWSQTALNKWMLMMIFFLMWCYHARFVEDVEEATVGDR